MGLEFGRETYRLGARERLMDARYLRDAGQWAGSVYLAGRAVEGMSRALIWAPAVSLETGHVLKDLAIKSRALGLLRSGKDEALIGAVSDVARLWHNNLRFAGSL